MNKPFVPPTGSASVEAISPWVDVARTVANGAREHAPALDADDSFPSADIAALASGGLLVAPFPSVYGGADLAIELDTAVDLARVLMLIGSGSLPLGRLYEGHVNAAKLISAYGRPEQVAHFADLARKGALFAVWNTETQDGVKLVNQGGARRLQGRKIFASGAGHVVHPLITARDERNDLLMVIPTVEDALRADPSTWRPHGMRASASGAVDFTGLPISSLQVIGSPDDFHAQPLFSAGAWRFAAVQTGGIAAVFDAARTHLVTVGRSDDPHQRARMGAAALAVHSAQLWVLDAARKADDATLPGDARVALVNFARSAVERAGLDVLELVHRSIGLAGFQRAHPLEKLTRDLATYLRQPNPDKALGDAAAWVLAGPTPILECWP